MHRAIKRAGFLTAMATAIAVAPGAGAADTHTIVVTATVLSKNNCRFSTATTNLAIGINPASTAPAMASTTLSLRCTGSGAVAVWSLANDNGLHGSGPASLRMQHQAQATQYLPYGLSYAASGSVAKNVWQDIAVTASVQPADFANAVAGSYSDSVTLTLLP
jgi:spore coat protein U-like protein